MLGRERAQIEDDLPTLAASYRAVVGVLDPNDRYLLPSSSVDQRGDVGDDRVDLVVPPDDVVLQVDDETCGVRSVLQCGHGVLSARCCLPPSGLSCQSSSLDRGFWMVRRGCRRRIDIVTATARNATTATAQPPAIARNANTPNSATATSATIAREGSLIRRPVVVGRQLRQNLEGPATGTGCQASSSHPPASCRVSVPCSRDERC
jgi:hypothetical protein